LIFAGGAGTNKAERQPVVNSDLGYRLAKSGLFRLAPLLSDFGQARGARADGRVS